MYETFVYIDGFNFYYGALKSSGYKWINPAMLAEKMFPNKNIGRIKFFTAPVKFRPDNPSQVNDQRTYWRALKTISNLEIVEGKFYTSRVRMPRVPSGQLVEVEKSEEKGSDVNIAAHMLTDGFLKRYSTAILFSGDSDLVTPVQMVRDVLGLDVIVVNPQLKSSKNKRSSKMLREAASMYRPDIKDSYLKDSQFPDVFCDKHGRIEKPKSWAPPTHLSCLPPMT